MSKLLAEKLIRDVPDFPKPGILFKDITPVMLEPQAFSEAIELMSQDTCKQKAEAIVGIESRGFVFAAAIAHSTGLPLILARKLGKLPAEKITEDYALEYGTNTVEMHTDALSYGKNVYIVDDLLATGGTASAACRLIERLEGTVCGIGFLVELTFLEGRKNIRGYHTNSLIQY